MQVTETVNTGLKREFKVVIAAADLNKELDAKLVDIAARAQIKGFRPGKVPVAHVRNLYGRSAMAEVIQATVDEKSRSIFAERKLKPAYAPDVNLPQDEKEVNAVMDGKADLAFTVASEVVPEFEVKDFSGLKLEKHVVAASDEAVQTAMKTLADNYKGFEPKSDGAVAAKGDRVTMDFVGTVDAKEFEGGKGQDIPLEIGSGQFIPGFEEQLIGTKVGQDLTVNVTFPANYGAAALAGKAASFAVKVKAVDGPAEAKIDDEFAKKIGFEDLAKLTAMVKTGVEGDHVRLTAMKLKRDVLDAMDKDYDFALPQKLVDAEFETIWNALSQEMQKAGKSFADENTTEDKARTDYRKIAERRVRLGLVLGTIGDKENVQITEQELQNALIARARQFPGQEKQVFEHYRKNSNALLELRGPIFEQKVVDLIVAKAVVSDKLVSAEDLRKLVEDEEDEEAAEA